MKAALITILVVALSPKATSKWCGIGCTVGCTGLGWLAGSPFGKRSVPCAERPDVLDGHKKCETDNMSALKVIKHNKRVFSLAGSKR